MSRKPLGLANIELDAGRLRVLMAQANAKLSRNLAAPVTASSFNGASFSDVSSSTQIDTSAQFGIPEGVKWVLIECHARDAAAWGTDGLYFACGRSSTYWYEFVVRPKGGDVMDGMGPCLVPCDANGDLWYRINASGTNTMDVWLMLIDYFY